MAASVASKQRDSFSRYTGDMLLALSAPCLIAVLYYGWPAVWMLLTCALTALACQVLTKGIRGAAKDGGLSAALFAGLAAALLLPSGFSLWKAAMGAAFAVLVASFPFGGAKYTPFSPPAAGFVFLSLCFPGEIFSAAPPTMFGSMANTLAPASAAPLSSMLQLGESVTPNALTYLNIFIGNVPAAIGTSCLAVLAGAALYLFIRNTDAWISSASFVTVCALVAVLFPRVLTGRKASLLMELSAGSLVFAAIFLLPHPAAAPKTPGKRVLFGGLAGLFCMLLRRFGTFQEGAPAAILLMECFWPALEGTFTRLKIKKEGEGAAHANG